MKKTTKFIFILFLLMAIAGSILISGRLGAGIRRGLALSYRSVLPALLPSMVLCGIIGEWLEVIPLPPTVTLWITSQLCGFPLGIRTVTQCYRRGLIDREDTIRLSACCSNASPAFLIAYLGKELLGNGRDGIILYLAQLLVSFHLGIVLEVFHGSVVKRNSYTPILRSISDSFSGAAVGGLNLTVYIAFFSAVATLFAGFPGAEILYGILELVGGISQFSNFYIIAALVGFSGWSVMMQNGTYLIEEQLPLWPMILAKIGYAVSLPLFAFFLRKNLLLNSFLLIIPGLFIIIFDKFRKRGYNKSNGYKRGIL